MTVAAGTGTVTYTGDGTEDTYATPPFVANADIDATIDGVALTEGVEYTLTGAGEAAGSMVLSSNLGNGEVLVITRTTPKTQPTAFRSQGSFSPGVHEDAFDRATFLVQELDRRATTLEAAVPYDMMAFIPGVPTNGQLMARLLVPRAVSLPLNLAGSYARSGVAATASTVLVLKRNGTNFGTCTFAPGGSTGTFSATAQSVAAGDYLDVYNAATADATLADVSVTLVGSRT